MDSDEEDDEVAAAYAVRLRLASAFHLLAAAEEARPGPKGKCRKKEVFRWEQHVKKLNEDEFKLRYRLGSESFYHLLRQLQPHLQPADKTRAAQANGGHAIEPPVKLAVALRFLAGGMVADLKLIYNLLAKSTVYALVWLVVDAINAVLVIEFPIGDQAKLAKLETGGINCHR